MVEPTILFGQFKIFNYYRYLLVLCGAILFSSLFLDVKGLDVDYVRHVSFWVIISCLGIWIFEDLIQRINTYLYELYLIKSGSVYQRREAYLNIAFFLAVLNISIQVVVWAIVFWRLILS